MLTPSERRGALIVIVLLALGTCWDLWRAAHPEFRKWVEIAPAPSVASPPLPLNASAPRDTLVTSGTALRSGRGKPLPARPLDLNRAAAEEFHALPGIGPVLAHRIVDYRQSHGRFTSIEELLAVRGIGPHLFQRIRPYVRV